MGPAAFGKRFLHLVGQAVTFLLLLHLLLHLHLLLLGINEM
jgi:hypothetical protein